MKIDNEELTVVDESHYLHLKRVPIGMEYAVYEKDPGTKQVYGIITADQLHGSINDFATARNAVIQSAGLCGDLVYKVAPRTLDKVQDAKRSWRKEHRDDNHDHSIRFITSHYDELFRVPDCATVEVNFPDDTVIGRCEYLDDYHFRFNREVFHICQFAELLETQFATCRPEPISNEDHGVWNLIGRAYLTVQATDTGWDYTIYDREFQPKDGGQLDDPSLSLNDAREAILKMHNLEYRNRSPENYDRIMEKVYAAEKSSVLEQLKGMTSEKTTHSGKQKGGDAR